MKSTHILPTAEEFFMKFKHTHSPVNHHLALIEFAKLHIEAALKEAAEQAEIENDWDNQKGNISKDSILNSYPLTNIK